MADVKCKILCVNCRKYLYFYKGPPMEDGTPLNAAAFRASGPDVPAPQAGTDMRCPKCGEPWYMTRDNGSLILMTNLGWMPRAPEGKPKIFVPGDQGLVAPEVPPEFKNGKADYREELRRTPSDNEVP